MLTTLTIATATIFLLLDSIIDLKTGEIPEKLTLGLAGITILVSAGHSILTLNPSIIATTAGIGALYYITGYILFKLGQWGGGDVKMLTGIGCVLGYLNTLNYSWINSTLTPYYINYFIDMAILATPYAFTYTLILGLLKPTVFRKYWRELKTMKVTLLLIISIIPSGIALHFNLKFLGIVYTLLPAFTLAAVYMKVVEKELLCKKIDVRELRVGDIIDKDIYDEGEKIASKKNIEGVDEEQLKKINELAADGRIPEEITIKWGVKFAPILFLSFPATVWMGNILEILFQSLQFQ
jgi:hypothetical protein